MNELDAGGEVDMPLPGIAAEPGRGQRQQRPQPLAAGGDDVAGELRNQRHLAAHAADDDLIHLGQVAGDKRLQPVQTWLFLRPAIVGQRDDIGQCFCPG